MFTDRLECIAEKEDTLCFRIANFMKPNSACTKTVKCTSLCVEFWANVIQEITSHSNLLFRPVRT